MITIVPSVITSTKKTLTLNLYDFGHHHHHEKPKKTKTWLGLSNIIEKTKLHLQIKKGLYLISSIASATPFGEMLAGLDIQSTAAQIASPVAGVSLMQALMHGKDRIAKYLWTLPVVVLSGLGRVVNLPTPLRRVLTVAALQGIEAMQDPSLHKHGDHYHGDTRPKLEYMLKRFKNPQMRNRLLQNLGRLELTINTAIPFAGFVRNKISGNQKSILGKTASWGLWLATLTAGIMGLDSAVESALKLFPKNKDEKQNDEFTAKEASLTCGHCGGIHVEASCPIALSEETAIAAG